MAKCCKSSVVLTYSWCSPHLLRGSTSVQDVAVAPQYRTTSEIALTSGWDFFWGQTITQRHVFTFQDSLVLYMGVTTVGEVSEMAQPGFSKYLRKSEKHFCIAAHKNTQYTAKAQFAEIFSKSRAQANSLKQSGL